MSDPANTRTTATRDKWDKAAATFDLMAGDGAEKRWRPAKQKLFSRMGTGKVLFLALGTGLDIACFPAEREVTALSLIHI